MGLGNCVVALSLCSLPWRWSCGAVVLVDQAAEDLDASYPIRHRAAGPTRGGSAAAAGSNPLQNPYHAGDNVEPATGSAYLTRSPLRQGMIDPVVRAAFADAG